MKPGTKAGKRRNKAPRDKPTEWQAKYGRRDDPDDDKSLADWIASVAAPSEPEPPTAAATAQPLFLPDGAGATSDKSDEDADADSLVAQMQKLLDAGVPSTNDLATNFCNTGLRDDSVDLGELSGLNFDQEFSKYLQTPIADDPLLQPTHRDDLLEEAFGGESMALLFRRTHDEKTLRRCFKALLAYTKDAQQLRCRAFMGWKRVARESKEVEGHLVRRMRRRHKIRRVRRILSLWLKLSRESLGKMQRASEWYTRRVTSKVFASWRRLAKAETAARLETAALAKADALYQSSLKRGVVSRWLAIAQRRKAETAKTVGESNSDAVAEESALTKPTGQLEEEEEGATPVPSCITPEKKMPAAAATNNAKSVDKENRQPNRTNTSNLLRPLKPLRPRPPRNPSTPKSIVAMNQRKVEREKRREILRQRYEQKAEEKQKQLEAEKHRKDEAEMRVHQEFLQRKAAEEHRKKAAAARRKQASRLAVLHYRLSLQKRMLLQWKRIFRVRAFDERKADIAWSDTMYEKCWQCWVVFAKEQQRRRREWMLKQQQLADDFDRRRLLAKSFAGLEEHCHYTRSQLEEARRRVSALRQRSVLANWHRVARKAQKRRLRREKKAAKHGRRLCLLRAVHAWRCGVKVLREEREINALIEAKWAQVNQWLEDC